MAKGLRPPQVTEPKAAIGRLPSRTPVIIRSHEGSAGIMREEWGAGIKWVVCPRGKVISH